MPTHNDIATSDTGLLACLAQSIEMALQEDLVGGTDVTTDLMPPDRIHRVGQWNLASRQPGRFCSTQVLTAILTRLAPDITISSYDNRADFESVEAGAVIARLAGPTGQMLGAERILLNYLQHLSGIATLTHRFVNTVSLTGARIFDTRKTTPGLRALEKHAVRVGGGCNHRFGLHDAVLIKDNHLVGIPRKRLAAEVGEMLNRIRTKPRQSPHAGAMHAEHDAPYTPGGPGTEPVRMLVTPLSFVEVECDDLDAFDALLTVRGVDVLLLDNFSIEDIREAVRRRDRAGLKGRIELEASGGITLENVRCIADAGVERIAVGAITHSAPILDLGLDAV